MLVQRKINGVDLVVNNRRPNELFFEQAFMELHPNLSKQLTPTDLCRLIADDK